MVLTDDPAFLPDLNLTQLPDGIDLDIDGHGTVFNLGDSIGISSMSFDMDNSVQHFSNVVSRVGSALGTPRVVDPMIATSDTMVGDYGFIPGPGLADEGDRFLDDIDFEFDADGEMRDLPMPPSEGDSMVGGRVASVGLSRRRRAGSVQSIGRGSRMGSEEAAAQVLREHEEGRDRSYGAGLTVISTLCICSLHLKTNFTSSTTTTIFMRLQKTIDLTSPTVLKRPKTTRSTYQWL